MTLQEFYVNMEGNYDDVKKRLLNEERIIKYLRRFCEDPTYADLTAYLAADNRTDAFRAAHTLKGLCANFGMETLGEPAFHLCEALRNRETKEVVSGWYEQVSEAYGTCVEAIRQIQ